MWFPVNFVLQNTFGATTTGNSRVKSKVNFDVYTTLPVTNIYNIRKNMCI